VQGVAGVLKPESLRDVIAAVVRTHGGSA
jgi:hypothetical protein